MKKRAKKEPLCNAEIPGFTLRCDLPKNHKGRRHHIATWDNFGEGMEVRCGDPKCDCHNHACRPRREAML
jgi:hypothetical protein